MPMIVPGVPPVDTAVQEQIRDLLADNLEETRRMRLGLEIAVDENLTEPDSDEDDGD